MMGGYWESHKDDVTSVRFHPDKKDVMASGSTDGQINLFDISQPDEDEALTVSHNTEDSVAKVKWFSKNNDPRFLSIMTHTEGLQLWDTDQAAPYQIFSRSDVTHGIRRSVADHTYLVNLHTHQEQGLTVVAGSSYPADPCLRLGRIRNKKIKPLANLRGGRGVVRTSVRLAGAGDDVFATGGEDGVVAVWRPGEKREEPDKSGKEKSSKKKRDKPY